MEERSSQLIVVVGASAAAENLRRRLLRCGKTHVGVANHTRGLRRMMVRGDFARFLICLSLDRNTMRRYDKQLQKMAADRGGFAAEIAFLGLIEDGKLTAKAAQIGCDMYVNNATDAVRAIGWLSRRRNRKPTICTLSNRCAGEPVSHDIVAAILGRTNSRACAIVAQHDSCHGASIQ